MKIKVENWYEDGHESTQYHDIDDIALIDGDDDYLENLLWEHTGDGHGIGNKLNSISEVTILECDRYPEWVGQVHEFGG